MDGAYHAAAHGLYPPVYDPTENVLLIAPGIMRVYALSFLLLPFNVYASYYCQSTLDSPGSMTVSVSRGILLSGALIIVLPLFSAEIPYGGQCRLPSCWWRCLHRCACFCALSAHKGRAKRLMPRSRICAKPFYCLFFC